MLDWLRADGLLNDAGWRSARTKLRTFGCIHVPLTAEELIDSLDQSSVANGELHEGFEARVIRESLLLAQSANALQLPLEGPWIVSVLSASREALRLLWGREIDDSTAVKAEWLVEIGEVAHFSGAFRGDFVFDRLCDLDAMTIVNLVIESTAELKPKQYSQWLDETYLRPMQARRPLVFETVRKIVKSHLQGLWERLEKNVPNAPVGMIRNVIGKAINAMPQTVRQSMSMDVELLSALGIDAYTQIEVRLSSGNPRFSSEDLYAAGAAAIDTGQPTRVCDLDGGEWTVSSTQAGAQAVSGDLKHAFLIGRANLFAQDTRLRLTELDNVVAQHGVAEFDCAPWRNRLKTAPFTAIELEVLDRDMRATPTSAMIELREKLERDGVAPSDLVQLDMRYYLRLVGDCGGQSTLPQFAESTSGFGYGDDVARKIEFGLARSIDRTLAPTALVLSCDLGALRKLVQRILPCIDSWSLIGLLECIVKRTDAFLELNDIVAEVLGKFVDVVSDTNSQLSLTANLAALVDGPNSTSGIFVGRPVFWRRLAGFAHAALIERELLQHDLCASDIESMATAERSKFQLATMADMPTDSRWHPLLLTASTLRHTLLLRARAALAPHRDFVVAAELGDSIFSPIESELETHLALTQMAIPGALGESLAVPPQDELRSFILRGLDEPASPLLERIEIAAHFCGFDCPLDDVAEKLAELMQQLDDVSAASDRLPDLLIKLAFVAAKTRSRPLAEVVLQHILSKSDWGFNARVYAALLACGWANEIESWTKSIVDAANRFVWKLSPSEAKQLQFALETLCAAQPLLVHRLAPTMARVSGAIAGSQ